MDTRESKTPEEEKEHVLSERIPEDFETSQPQLQPEELLVIQNIELWFYFVQPHPILN